MQTQQSQEKLNPRAVAVVLDPVQSVKGKVVIDAFRSIDQQTIMMRAEPRQTTSNIGHLNRPSYNALSHGLNKHYYSIAINYRKSELEQKMLLNLNKSAWGNSLKLREYTEQHKENIDALKNFAKLSKQYNKWIQDETKQSSGDFVVTSVGKMNPKVHLNNQVEESMNDNVMNCLGTMLNTVVF